jgi:hypothetical protein
MRTVIFFKNYKSEVWSQNQIMSTKIISSVKVAEIKNAGFFNGQRYIVSIKEFQCIY